jgi:hypothetical protein
MILRCRLLPVLLFAVFGTHAFGQSNALTIPSSHPRIYWTPARIATARAWYASHPFTPSNDGTGANQYMQMATKYIMTGNAGDCQTAVNWAASFSAGTFSVQSDPFRNNGEAVAIVYDWCYPVWTAAQRSTIIAQYNSDLTSVMNASWGDTSMPFSNYFWGTIRSAFEWGVATYGENASATTFIDESLAKRWAAFTTWSLTTGKGGVFQEGSQYGRYQARYFSIPLQAAALMGRNLLSETNAYKEHVMNMIYSMTPGPTGGSYYTLQFGDDQNEADVSYERNYPTFMSMMAQLYAGTNIGGYARQWLSTTGVTPDYFATSVDPGGAALSFSGLPLDYYAPGAGFFYARSKWAPDATYVQIQGGQENQWSHNHLDSGNFHIWRNGQWLTLESTGYSHSITGWGGTGTAGVADTVGHNGLVYDGKGIAYAYRSGTPNVTRVETTNDYAYMSTDISGMYKSTSATYDVPQQVSTVREFVFVRGLETLVVLDRLQSSSTSTSKGMMLHFAASPSVVGNHIVGTAGTQTLDINVVRPASLSASRIVNEGTYGQYRVELETTGSTLSYFLAAYQARDTSGAPLTINSSEDATTITLTLQHPTKGTAKLVFVKGAASTGGQFGFSTSGVPTTLTSLGTGVQGISVTDQGVVWSGGNPPPPPSTTSACDLNGDGLVNGVDYTLVLNQALGIAPCTNGDLVGNGQCNVVDVQRVAIAISGGACRVGQ